MLSFYIVDNREEDYEKVGKKKSVDNTWTISTARNKFFLYTGSRKSLSETTDILFSFDKEIATVSGEIVFFFSFIKNKVQIHREKVSL